MPRNVPVTRPAPDAGQFIDGLLGRTTSARPPLVEYLVDEVVMRPIVVELLEREWVQAGDDRASQSASLDNFIAFWYRMGYDYVRYEQGLGFDVRRLLTADTATGSGHQEEDSGMPF